MSATAPAPVPASPATPGAPPAAAPARAAGRPTVTDPGMPLVRPAADTPTTLSRLRVGASLVALLGAALLALQLVTTWQATSRAQGDTAQLLRIQQVKVDVLRADALATNAFLIGGLEPAAQRAAYDEAITRASSSVADAAQAQPADRDALAALNRALVDYAEAMEQARANNRQGFPVGSAYLTRADANLRADALPVLDALVKANTERSDDSLGTPNAILPALTGLVVLALLHLSNRWVSRRFRRRFNPGLVGAAALVLLLTVGAVWAISGQRSANSALLDGSQRAAVSGAEARSAANDAKANESLRLINRGQGKPFEDAWASSAKVVSTELARDFPGQSGAWQAYAAAHADVARLDDGGDWEQARDLAVSTAADAPSTRFADLDAALAREVTQAGDRATADLGTRLTTFLLLALATALGGLGAAALAWRGVTARLKEYA